MRRVLRCRRVLVGTAADGAGTTTGLAGLAGASGVLGVLGTVGGVTGGVAGGSTGGSTGGSSVTGTQPLLSVASPEGQFCEYVSPSNTKGGIISSTF